MPATMKNLSILKDDNFTHSPFLALLAIIAIAIALILYKYKQQRENILFSGRKQHLQLPEQMAPVSKSMKKEKVCPFSKECNFLIEIVDNVLPSPFDLFQAWQHDKMPLAARWLNAGISGQDRPGRISMGLKRFRDTHHLLVQDANMRKELTIKNRAFDDPTRHNVCFQMEQQSIEAQAECLRCFLDYLPKRYPQEYVYNKQAGTIHVNCINRTFHLKDYKNNCLELCGRIVQEDLILIRPEELAVKACSTNEEGKTLLQAPIHTYKMTAAAVVFSFAELDEKLGQKIWLIHRPVPGLNEHIGKA